MNVLALLTVSPALGTYAELLLPAAQRFGIIQPLHWAHWIAQLAHESGGFRHTVENLNYSAEALRRTWPARFTETEAHDFARQPDRIAERVYGGRLGNGPEGTGDGARYTGRGLIQLTGKANYDRYSKLCYGDDRLVTDPDLARRPPAACLVAAAYWYQLRLNELAESDDLKAITRAINGGLNGLTDRERWLKRTKVAFGVPEKEL